MGGKYAKVSLKNNRFIGKAGSDHKKNFTKLVTFYNLLLVLLFSILSVPKVQAVVYTTCSVFSEENENVVTKVMDYTNERISGKTPFRMIPPVIPLTPRDLETQKSTKYLTIEPSELMGGCFVAALSREVRCFLIWLIYFLS